MLPPTLRYKISALIDQSRFHIFRPSLSRSIALDRIDTAVDQYISQYVKDLMVKSESKEADILGDLLYSLEDVLRDREENDMSDDMITIGNIEIAVLEARNKLKGLHAE